MGCDIHLFVEKKENNWKAIKGDNPFKDFEGEPELIYKDWFWDKRNYSLFSILGGVRNYYDIEPISKPKGFPEDVSYIVKSKLSTYGFYHSHSYLTFKELLNHNWNKKIEKEGFVTKEVYKEFKNGGKPYPNSRDVFGASVNKISNEEMDKVIENDDKGKYYTKIKWEETHKEISGGFIDEINDFIEKENIKDLEKYRIVFAFDN